MQKRTRKKQNLPVVQKQIQEKIKIKQKNFRMIHVFLAEKILVYQCRTAFSGSISYGTYAGEMSICKSQNCT